MSRSDANTGDVNRDEAQANPESNLPKIQQSDEKNAQKSADSNESNVNSHQAQYNALAAEMSHHINEPITPNQMPGYFYVYPSTLAAYPTSPGVNGSPEWTAAETMQPYMNHHFFKSGAYSPLIYHHPQTPTYLSPGEYQQWQQAIVATSFSNEVNKQQQQPVFTYNENKTAQTPSAYLQNEFVYYNYMQPGRLAQHPSMPLTDNNNNNITTSNNNNTSNNANSNNSNINHNQTSVNNSNGSSSYKLSSNSKSSGKSKHRQVEDSQSNDKTMLNNGYDKSTSSTITGKTSTTTGSSNSGKMKSKSNKTVSAQSGEEKKWSDIVTGDRLNSETNKSDNDQNNLENNNHGSASSYSKNDNENEKNKKGSYSHQNSQPSSSNNYDETKKSEKYPTRNFNNSYRYNDFHYPGTYDPYYSPDYLNFIQPGIQFDFANLNLYNNNNYRPHPHNYYYNNNSYTTTPSRPELEKYNLKDYFFNGEKEGLPNSKFFVIKSYSKEDIVHSIKHGIWCSTQVGNAKLNQAFDDAQTSSVYLFFSVNGSGQFCGCAEMVSRVDFESKSELWAQDKWKGKFDVKWIYVKDVPNAKLRHIILENNENKPVTNSRDAQEVFFEQGAEMFNIIRSFKHKTSILDDVDLNSFIDVGVTSSNGDVNNQSAAAATSSSAAKSHSYKQFKLQNKIPAANAELKSNTSKSAEIQVKKILSKNDQKESKKEENSEELTNKNMNSNGN